jgi:AraC-like DNA-binding protein
MRTNSTLMSECFDRMRVVTHQSGQGRWRMDMLAPRPALAEFVRRFNAYAERDTSFARRRELPAGHAVLLFNLGAELRVEDTSGIRHRFTGGSGLYSGPSSSYVVSETDGAQEGAQVELTLPGARLLLGRPLEELGDRMIDPADLFGVEADETLGRVMEAPSPAARLAVLEQAVERRIGRTENGAPRDLAWAWRRLQASGGRAAIGVLAGEIGCSRKHLTIRFRREFGISPKLLARILRFDRAVGLIRAERVANWADLAAACGYADQAHLTREFHAFAGSPPTAFLRHRLPDQGGFVD